MEHPLDLQFTLGKMTGQLDAILKQLESTTEDHKELKERVSTIENKISKAAGVIAVFASFISVAATYVWKKVVG